jgi:hypothetical protein
MKREENAASLPLEKEWKDSISIERKGSMSTVSREERLHIYHENEEKA